MKKSTKVTENTWRAVKQMVDAGWRLVDIEKRLGGLLTAGQISAKKQKWKKAEYKTDSKYAKYHTDAYKKWRIAVLQRDGYKCVVCKRGYGQVRALQADHIKSWSRYPDLRYTISNGRTLCVYHHKRTLNYGYKANTCDDAANGKAWEIKERILWKQSQQKKLQSKVKKSQQTANRSRKAKNSSRSVGQK